MKKFVAATFLLVFAFTLNAQVTLQKKYDYSTSIVQLETLGYKYFLMDVVNGQCRIYNLDHSLFKTINCNVPDNYYLYDIKFISEKIFDTDDGIELLCTFSKYNQSLLYYEYDSKIINEDGTLIHFIEGGLYNYQKYTDSRTSKLLSYCYDFSVSPQKVWTEIYNLPKKVVYGEEYVSICSGGEYLGWTEPGVYQRTLIVEDGLDSIVSTHLTLIPFEESNEEVSICEGENYMGWTEAGNYSKKYTSITGCDSVVNTALFITSPVETVLDTVICQGESYRGYDSEGKYSESFYTSLGCDSNVVINLSFYSALKPEIIISGDTLKCNTHFENYQWYNNENEIPGANKSEYIISNSGQYSLKVFNPNSCSTFSESVNVIYSLGNNIGTNKNMYSVIPNPNNGRFIFRVNSYLPGKIVLKLLNYKGQVIDTRQFENVKTNYSEYFNHNNLAKGMYYLQIEENNTIKTEKIIIK